MGKTRFAFALLCSSLALLSACSEGSSAGENGSSVDTSGLILTAEINKESSSVTLPGDRFVFKLHETFILQSAMMGAAAKCAREELGVPWTGVSISEAPHPSRLMWYELGPWTIDMASKYGFAPPAPEGTLQRNGILPRPQGWKEEDVVGPNDNISQADSRRVQENCIEGREDVLQFDELSLHLNHGPGYAELSNTREKMFKDERTKKAIKELYQCYRDEGMEPEDSSPDTGAPGIEVKGANPLTINEEQIQLALKVVACKEKVDFVPRVARIWAEIQAPIIEEYAEEFLDQRNKIDSVLTKAKAFIAENPDVYQQVQK